jgi:hypothetical protein
MGSWQKDQMCGPLLGELSTGWPALHDCRLLHQNEATKSPACLVMAWSCYSAHLRVVIGMPDQGLKLKIKYSEHQCFLDD